LGSTPVCVVEVMTHPGAAVPIAEAHCWGCGEGADEFSSSIDRDFEAMQLKTVQHLGEI
jgi:hypothetical protein